MPSLLGALLRRHVGSPGLPPLQATLAPKCHRRRVLPGVLDRLLGLADGDVHNQLRELVRITRTLA
jgi:hypothetical protein